MTKPKPAPAKPAAQETPATPPPQGGEQQTQAGEANANAGTYDAAAAGPGEVPPTSAEAMETDKPEGAPSNA